MTQFTALPHDIQQASTNCLNTSEEVQSQLSSLQNYVYDLEGQWQGVASQNFMSLMADWNIYARMLHQSLIGISEGLRGNWQNYSQSEEQNIAQLQAVNGSLPGAPGATIG